MIGQELLKYLIDERKKAWDIVYAMDPRYQMTLICQRLAVEEPDRIPDILKYWAADARFVALSDALKKFQLLALAEGIEIHLPTFLGDNPPPPEIKFLERPNERRTADLL